MVQRYTTQVLRNTILVFVVLWYSLGFSSPQKLVLKEIRFADAPYEISGLTQFQGHLLFVSDNESDHFIYKIQEVGASSFTSTKWLDLETIPGFKEYRGRLDLEGIATCGNTLYLADERARNIVEIPMDATPVKSRLQVHALTPWPVKALFDGGSNAGLEGVAIDCRSQRLYALKERQPRLLVTYSLRRRSIEGVFAPEPGNVDQEFLDGTDLHFANNSLYLLARNSREIIKLNSRTFQILDRVSFLAHEKDLYDTGEPFGIAEGLFLTEKEIIIGLDNNSKPLSKRSIAAYGVSGNASAILKFKRPKGF